MLESYHIITHISEGVKAKIDGLMIGGKTGTAHIAENGVYVRKYNSSFFGFANDSKNRFTIGVLVIILLGLGYLYFDQQQKSLSHLN